MSKSGGFFYISMDDNYEQTNGIHLEFFTQAGNTTNKFG